MDHEIKPEQREKDGKRQVTAAEEQHQAGEVAAARKRALSQRAMAVKKIEVLLNSVYSGDYRLQAPRNTSWSNYTYIAVQALMAMHERPFGHPRASPLCSPASWTK